MEKVRGFLDLFDGPQVVAALAEVEEWEAERDRLTEALSDAVSWIENYPLNEGSEYSHDWGVIVQTGRAALVGEAKP
jgi:hypothetical protein